MPLQAWVPYSGAVFREETSLGLSSLSAALDLRGLAAPARGSLLPAQKEEPGRKSWEGREAGLPWRVTDGGTQQGFPPLSCDLAGAGQDPGGEKFSAPLASTEVSLSHVGLHFYVCVPLISLLDSVCSFSHSLIFSNNIHCSQYS